jgi:SAM-dependent methyltransferase
MTGETVLPPYEGVAPFYDAILGREGFAAIWTAFRRARRRFHLRWDTAGAADLACGTGLFLEALARLTPERVPLYGVDRSPAMLGVAARRLQGVRLIAADMVSVRLPQPVDMITCNFAALNYITRTSDLDRFASTLSKNLHCRGHAIFDMLSSDGSGFATPFCQSIERSNFRARWTISPRLDQNGSRTAMWNCSRRNNQWQCWSETHSQRWWPVSDVIAALGRAGLRCLGVDPVELGGKGTRWMQVVARRV